MPSEGYSDVLQLKGCGRSGSINNNYYYLFYFYLQMQGMELIILLSSRHTFFVNLFLAGSLLLHRLFSRCSEWDSSLAVVRGLLIAVTSLVAEHGL